jgi:hypothetical protein
MIQITITRPTAKIHYRSNPFVNIWQEINSSYVPFSLVKTDYRKRCISKIITSCFQYCILVHSTYTSFLNENLHTPLQNYFTQNFTNNVTDTIVLTYLYILNCTHFYTLILWLKVFFHKIFDKLEILLTCFPYYKMATNSANF